MVDLHRRDHVASILSIALEASGLEAGKTDTERMDILNKMAEGLVSAGFVVLHENDLSAIANVATPTFIQQAAEKEIQAGAEWSRGFDEWNVALDKVSDDSMNRVKHIITEKY